MKIKLYVNQIRAAAAYIRKKAPDFRPDVGFILGSGLAKAVPPLEKARIIPYNDIPGFPRTTVPGHEGKLILGRSAGKNVAVMQGRFHYYEGHAMESIALPVRTLEYLGLKTLIVTAAVGSMREKIKPGHFTVVTDHINLMGRNPLRAFHEDEFGTMFPDMTEAYDAGVRKTMLSVCRKRKTAIHEGVYVAVGGPSYETPAEIRAFRALGGDVVGMSVVPEVVPARQMGLKTAALVWTSNMAAGLPGAIQNHGDVLALGAKVSDDLRAVLSDLIAALKPGMLFLDLIAKKRDGGRHTPEELAFVARAAATGLVPDYQLSAWLMAVTCRGMDEAETVALTRAMARSGETLGLGKLGRRKADKHSTGGVGDGVSLALAPLAAACGLAVPMMSGRGLGHTGGTLDKLESIPGFKVRLPLPRIRSQMRKLGVCLFGQSENLAPADRTLYALRDATATVPARPLIVGSILSKKAAEELDALVLDVKVGSGAIFRDAASARGLAGALVKTSKGLGIPTVAVLTAMEQPLGRYVGNALEVRQALEILNGVETAPDYLECTLVLGGWMLKLSGLAKSAEHGADMMRSKITDGSGLKIFRDIVKAQGGDARVVDNPDRLVEAKRSRKITAARDGFVTKLDARKIGHAGVLIAAGRAYKEQPLDYGAGLILEKKVGDKVRKGETLAILRAADETRLNAGQKEYLSALEIGPKAPRRAPLVIEIIR